MSVKWGGKQSILHESTVTEAGLGPGVAVQLVPDGHGGVVQKDCKLKPGEKQSFHFTADGPPPFYDQQARREDYIDPSNPTKTVTPRKSKKNPNPQPQMVENILPGYVGKPKGMKQILWERGKWLPTMTADHDTPELSMKKVLSSCPDFVEETTAMQDLVESRGHILCLSPKYSPEVAGVGVEFSFGRSKMSFRRTYNDRVAAHLQDNVLRSISTEGPDAVLPLSLVWKYARRARDYMRAYADPSKPSNFLLIEKMCKKVKTHRCVQDQDFFFITSA